MADGRGRFTATERHLGEEDRLELTSVGVDIGSSTSHLLFSRLELERRDTRYITTRRELLYASEILLTPYLEGNTIDGAVLGSFFEAQYRAAGLAREQVDTGALILTGVALLRQNARTIAELFAAEAGRFVAVSAGDSLEATMAAHGSGAVALSAQAGGQRVLNVDLGGGTSKLVVCDHGQVGELMALDIGARLVAYDAAGRLARLEPAGRALAAELGLALELGGPVEPAALERLAAALVQRLIDAIRPDGPGPDPRLLRTPPLGQRGPFDAVTFSGGVAEYLYGRQREPLGDLGALLAAGLRARAAELGAPLVEAGGGIRATVIGASQYTVQVSGSTIFVAPLEVLPIRGMPVVAPRYDWPDELDAAAVAAATRAALARQDLLEAEQPVALALRWQGSATFVRLQAFCGGLVAGLREHLTRGHPLVLVSDGDFGGLLGLHLREELRLTSPVVSIDGVELREFDYVDIGTLLPSSGAVPVVVKSLIFPTPAAAPAAVPSLLEAHPS